MLNNLNDMSNSGRRIFFCGIGGVSMSGLAAVTASLGYTVLGSDISPTKEIIKLCREHKIEFFSSHSAQNVIGCDIFVYSAAIKDDNPELLYAKSHGLRIFTRSQYLGKLTEEYENSVAVAGTHGKSTVTHMLYSIFNAGGYDPMLLAGARGADGKAFSRGSNSTVIYEACEYNRSFLDLHPKIAVILNIEREHTDTYPTVKDAEQAYYDFGKEAKICVLSYDCRSCRRLGARLKKSGATVYYFSLCDKRADAYAENLKEINGRYCFDLNIFKETVGNVNLSVVGQHNAINAVAGALTARICGIDPVHSLQALMSFRGIKRRFEFIGTVNGADVYDDYAHHPTEIAATLSAASALGYERIICAFQPHTYSRTKDFFTEFCNVFSLCDEVVFADIFAAREKNIYGISSELLALNTKNGKYISSFTEISNYLKQNAKEGTLIITMGAGRMNEIAYAITENGYQGKD